MKKAAGSSWLDEFRRVHGRPPRVLHVGNIANNAYHNAKLLRASGFDCDVICNDYYHIMACPEWEDADFGGEVRNQLYPDWHSLDLRGFARPPWFAQGPLRLCVAYLTAARDGKTFRAGLLWIALGVMRRLLTLRWFRVAWLGRLEPGCGSLLRLAAVPVLNFRGWLRSTRNEFSLRARRRRAPKPGTPAPAPPGGGESFQSRIEGLVSDFKRRFPGREDTLALQDMEDPWRRAEALWSRLFRRYDLVQAYATASIPPMLCGYSPYVALEHGTLRSIPAENSPRGRLTSLSYARAGHVFVTNVDCVAAAQNLAPGRYTVINHPFDENHSRSVSGWEEYRANLLKRTGADWLFFFPTRHDWVPGTGFADKGNDRFFRAVARLKREDGIITGIACCSWGSNVPESRALIKELGLEENVVWTPPLGLVRFERTTLACDYVTDQFCLGAFGGIAFKALAAGRPVIGYLDPALVRAVYAEPPPILNCRTEEEILTLLRNLHKAAAEWKNLCRRARAWTEKFHSGAETAARQAEIYGRILMPEAVERGT